VARPEFRFVPMNWAWTPNPQSSGWFVTITGGPEGVPWQSWPHREVGGDETAAQAARDLIATRLGTEEFNLVVHRFQAGWEDTPGNQSTP